VLQICMASNLKGIATSCRFPDWLGYLGLILVHMKSPTPCYKGLSATWANSLSSIVNDQSQVQSQLVDISSNDKAVLTIAELENCEASMMPMYSCNYA